MIQKFQNKQAPNLNMLFLNLYIRRAHLVNDSLAEVGDLSEFVSLIIFCILIGDKKT
jgi:hypothetical protein